MGIKVAVALVSTYSQVMASKSSALLVAKPSLDQFCHDNDDRRTSSPKMVVAGGRV